MSSKTLAFLLRSSFFYSFFFCFSHGLSLIWQYHWAGEGWHEQGRSPAWTSRHVALSRHAPHRAIKWARWWAFPRKVFGTWGAQIPRCSRGVYAIYLCWRLYKALMWMWWTQNNWIVMPLYLTRLSTPLLHRKSWLRATLRQHNTVGKRHSTDWFSKWYWKKILVIISPLHMNIFFKWSLLVASSIFWTGHGHPGTGYSSGLSQIKIIRRARLMHHLSYTTRLVRWEGVRCCCVLTVRTPPTLAYSTSLVVDERPGTAVVGHIVAIELVTTALLKFPHAADPGIVRFQCYDPQMGKGGCRGTFPILVWWLPLHSSLLLCVFIPCCAMDSSLAYSVYCRSTKVDQSFLDYVTRCSRHGFINRRVHDLVELVGPSPKRNARGADVADRRYVTWTVDWVVHSAEQGGPANAISYMSPLSRLGAGNADFPPVLPIVFDSHSVTLEAEGKWNMSDTGWSGKIVVCSSLHADFTIICDNCVE